MSPQPAQEALHFDLAGSSLCSCVISLKSLPLSSLLVNFSNNNKQKITFPQPARKSRQAQDHI